MQREAAEAMQAQQRQAAEGMIARACVLVDNGMMEEATALLARAAHAYQQVYIYMASYYYITTALLARTAQAYQQVYMCPHTNTLRPPSLLEPLTPTSRYMYLSMYACVYVSVYVCITYVYASWYMYVCMHACIYVCMYVGMYVYIYTYMYIYI